MSRGENIITYVLFSQVVQLAPEQCVLAYSTALSEKDVTQALHFTMLQELSTCTCISLMTVY